MSIENTKMNSQILSNHNSLMEIEQDSVIATTKDDVSIALQDASIIPTQQLDSYLTAEDNYSSKQSYLDEITAKILLHKKKTEQSFIEIGKLLIEAKKELPHGHWLPWLHNNIEFSVPTAQRLMRIAEEFSNASPVTHLGFTKASILVTLPPDEIDDFIAETYEINGANKRIEDMSKRELQNIVCMHKKNKRMSQAPWCEDYNINPFQDGKNSCIGAKNKSEMHSMLNNNTLSKVHTEDSIWEIEGIKKFIDRLQGEFTEIKVLCEYEEIVSSLQNISEMIYNYISSVKLDVS